MKDGALDEPMEVIGRAIWNSSQTNASNTSAIFLGCDCYQRLARNTPSFLSWRHTADLGFVYLDSTAESIPTGPHHGPAQFVQHCPSSLIAAQTQNAL